MRTLIILAIIVGLGYLTVTNYVRNGKVEQFLDAHPATLRNAAIEYYWGVGLRYTHYDQAAIFRYRRVIQKYPDTAYAPLAWVDIIDMLDEQKDREGVFREVAQFVVNYPDHPKVEYLRKKVYFLQSGI
jgi:outer membrane protein assembly factor BamD (BamD/ComL family)